MGELTIKPAIKTDEIELIATLAKEIWTEHFTPIIGAQQVEYMLMRFQSYYAIKKQIEKQGYQYYLFLLNHENAGYMAIQKQEKQLFLSKIYVLKSFRNQKIASRALDFLATECQKNGLQKIWLTVNKNNIHSIEAYKKIGFTIEKPLITDIGNGFVMDDYIMEKVF